MYGMSLPTSYTYTYMYMCMYTIHVCTCTHLSDVHVHVIYYVGNDFGDALTERLEKRAGMTKKLTQSTVPMTKVKIHLVGDSGVGKTKLKRSLLRYYNLFVTDASAADEPKLLSERTRGAGRR